MPQIAENNPQEQSDGFSRQATYRIDLAVLIMFAGTLLDVGTTWFFVSHGRGCELNPVLAPLIRHSLFWIPIYLLSRPLLVPFVPETCRLPFCLYFGLSSWLFGVNNLGGILWGRYFFMDLMRFQTLEGACVVITILFFAWTLWKRVSSRRERKQQLVIASRWIGIFLLVELGFFVAGKL